MFSSLMSLFFGGEAKQHPPVDSAVDAADVQELTDSFLDEDYIPSTDNDENKENAHGLVDFETNEDEDWLLVNVSPACSPLSVRETNSEEVEELHRSVAQITPAKQLQRKLSQEISVSLKDKSTVQDFFRTEEWEWIVKDRETPSQCEVQYCPGTASPAAELARIISSITSSEEDMQSFSNILLSGRKLCAPCFMDCHIRHSASLSHSGFTQIWTTDVNCTNYVQLVKEMNTRRTCDTAEVACPPAGLELLHRFSNRQPIVPPKPDLLEHIKIVKPQQKARELNLRKYLSPSQIDRQNKVKLYEGKAKNNRRKDLWRCHSGANNNRKCC